MTKKKPEQFPASGGPDGTLSYFDSGRIVSPTPTLAASGCQASEMRNVFRSRTMHRVVQGGCAVGPKVGKDVIILFCQPLPRQ